MHYLNNYTIIYKINYRIKLLVNFDLDLGNVLILVQI